VARLCQAGAVSAHADGDWRGVALSPERGSNSYALEEETVAVIRLPEIEEIFTVLDRRGISREAVVIPLTKRDPGSVRVLANEKLEIVVPESQSVQSWLPELERHIDAVMGSTDG
jgi:hypothetical protein